MIQLTKKVEGVEIQNTCSKPIKIEMKLGYQIFYYIGWKNMSLKTLNLVINILLYFLQRKENIKIQNFFVENR